MTKDIFDNDLHDYLNEDEQFECPVCGTPVDNDGDYCCRECFYADMM